MAHLDNPAGRLEDFLRHLKVANAGMSSKDAVTSILGAANDAEFAHAFGNLLLLPQQAEDALRKVAEQDEHDDPDWYLQWRPAINQTLSQLWAFTSAVKSTQDHYSDADLMNLGACSNLLHRAHLEPELPWSQIDELRQHTREFEEAIHEASLPEPVKRFLLEQVDRINEALRECRLRGVAAFEEAFDAAIGASWRLSRNPEVDTSAAPVKPMMEKLKGLLAQIQMMVTIATGVAELPAKADASLTAILPGA